jgi:hypothetical protein
MMETRRIGTRNLAMGLTLATLAVPLPVLAAPCVAGTGTTLVAQANCDYGVPARSGDLLLVPKVCRTPVEGKLFERHAVEVRHGTTGAKQGQAALTAVAVQAAAPLPAPGVLLGGEYPLLVLPAGIAALEPRAGKAELVYEPQGLLLGVARHGEVLAIVEVAAPDEHFPKGAIEWTVLDYGAGEVIGQMRLAGQDLEGLSLRTAAGGGLEAVLERVAPTAKGAVHDPAKHIEIVAPVRDAQGKPAAPGGALQAKVRPLGPRLAVAAKAGPGQCALLPATTSVLIGRPKLVLSPVPARTVAATGDASMLPVPGMEGCLGIQELDDQGRAWAWFKPATGPHELRPLRCPK